MSDEHERAFLQSVIDEADDDTPRLIFADWLEENGDPQRAQFIRLQCQLAKVRDDDPESLRLRFEERPLFQVMWERLNDKARGKRPGALLAWTRGQGLAFERGFVATMRTTATRFLDGADALMRATPLQHLGLTNVGPKIDAVLASPHLARLRSLNFEHNKLRDELLAKLAACPGLAKLKRLDLGHNRFRIDGTVALANSPHLAGLERLSLVNNRIHDRGPEALAQSPHLRNLKWLDLYDCQLGPRGAAALGQSPVLGNLEHLDLSRNRIQDRGARDLAEGGGLKNLAWLELSLTPLTSAGVEALLTSSALPKLTRLSVWVEGRSADAWSITPARHLVGRLDFFPRFQERGEIAQMPDSPLLEACAALTLSHERVQKEQIDRLGRHVSRLQSLTLDSVNMGPVTLKALVNSANWKSLRRLSLVNNSFGDDGAEVLASSPLIRQLTHLDLSYCKVSRKGAKVLASAEGLENLVSLRMVDWEHYVIQNRNILRERFGWRVTFE